MHDHIVIGAGPAGLMAADILSEAGHRVTVFERMPSPGRKLLIAGRGGLNLTHAEPLERFITRYADAAPWLAPVVEAFPPSALVAWAEGLGQETFTGTSGRIFPKTLKASPLLRAWLQRLDARGVAIRTRHEWLGWNEAGACVFRDGNGDMVTATASTTILALGGASWPRLGSTGAWAPILAAKGVTVSPLRPANCGVDVAWSPHVLPRFEGAPLNGISLAFDGVTVRGEAVLTRYGLEGGAVYALAARIRDAVAAHGPVTLHLDLRPGQAPEALAERIARVRPGESVANILRKALDLAPVAAAVMREAHGPRLATRPAALAAQVKDVPLTVTGVQGLARAISTAGGISLAELDAALMIRRLPGVYAVGEMLDWEAPTGGYLLQACFATAAAAARAILRASPAA